MTGTPPSRYNRILYEAAAVRVPRGSSTTFLQKQKHIIREKSSKYILFLEWLRAGGLYSRLGDWASTEVKRGSLDAPFIMAAYPVDSRAPLLYRMCKGGRMDVSASQRSSLW
jgi:hypothetical protein